MSPKAHRITENGPYPRLYPPLIAQFLVGLFIDQHLAAAPAHSRQPSRPNAERPRPATDSLTTSVLLRHGPAPFEFQAHGTPSYFVTVRTERGARTLWGRGLERAFNESRTQPQPGEAIGIRENGIDPMTVIMRERDPAGQVRLEKRLETSRGHWLIERRGFFDERAIAARLPPRSRLQPPRTPRRLLGPRQRRQNRRRAHCQLRQPPALHQLGARSPRPRHRTGRTPPSTALAPYRRGGTPPRSRSVERLGKAAWPHPLSNRTNPYNWNIAGRRAALPSNVAIA